MSAKQAAPGPYEVVIVIDEEGKARGKNGEQWILIRNERGAIATVYPGQDAEATANLLAAAPKLLEACKKMLGDLGDDLAVEYTESLRATIAKAEGSL